MAVSSEIWSISQLTRRIKSVLEDTIGPVWVSGEISNWKLAASGHAYFTLKDDQCQMDAVIFRGSLSRLRFEPENGLEVLAHGRVTVYERRGNYQILIDDLQQRGVGALQLAFEKLKKKLDAEGLFDAAHKKPLPVLPKRIGIVTSPTGAAIRDILHVLNRRFANVHVLLYPSRVQGKEAAAELVAGIRALDSYGVDVIIVGRGGGSLEDLWPFNEEPVVRAVFAANTPIISAVGHEIDFTLTDFAADLRAPTPSAAAELVVREQEAMLDALRILRGRLAQAACRGTERARHRYAVLHNSYVFRRPEELVRQRRQQCDELRMRLEGALTERLRADRHRMAQAARSLTLLSPQRQLREARERLLLSRARMLRAASGLSERARARLRPLLAQLDALSPLAILSRGYALAFKMPERVLVRNSGMLAADDEVYLRFGAGAATARIIATEEADHGQTEKRT